MELIQESVQALEPILGRRNVDALIYAFKTRLPLVNAGKSYSFADIEAVLKKVFSEEATLLLLRPITKELFERDKKEIK